MNIDEIKLLASKGESEILEFKKTTKNLQAAFETICGFLNGNGGRVFFGVKDNGDLVGQDISDSTRRDIAKHISRLEPSTQPDIQYIDFVDDKKIIVVSVNAGKHAPYLYDGRMYQRSQSRTEKMSQYQYEQLLEQRGRVNHSWEEAVNDNYTFDSLDKDLIYKTVSTAIRHGRMPDSMSRDSIESILYRYGLTKDGKLKNAAIVLFAQQKDLQLTQCTLKMARFNGDDKLSDIIDSKQLRTNAFGVLDEVDTFLRKHLLIASFFEKNQFQRIDKPTLPVLAVREALVNAICHKSYFEPNGSIMLAIYNNRIELWSNGTLPKPLKIEDLLKVHHSVPRNTLIADVFYSVKLIETWGTGTTRMAERCIEENIPAPIFKENTGGIEVIFNFKTPINVSALPKIDLQSRRKEILLLLNDGPLSAERIRDLLQQPPSLRTVKADLSALKASGLIQQTGKGRQSQWVKC